MISSAQKGKAQVDAIFILHSPAWVTPTLAVVCDLLVFYKPATNVATNLYKFAICNSGHDHDYK